VLKGDLIFADEEGVPPNLTSLKLELLLGTTTK
jgi:hypothetical protein